MAKKQTRRSVSMSREFYDRLKAYCDANGVSMSQVVTEQAEPHLAAWEAKKS